MDVIEDQALFDEKQEQFVSTLVSTLRSGLEEQGLDEQTVYNLTSSLCFSVSALIDGSASCGDPSNPTFSYLAFRKAQDLDALVTSATGSYLHEISEGIVDNEFL